MKEELNEENWTRARRLFFQFQILILFQISDFGFRIFMPANRWNSAT